MLNVNVTSVLLLETNLPKLNFSFLYFSLLLSSLDIVFFKLLKKLINYPPFLKF